MSFSIHPAGIEKAPWQWDAQQLCEMLDQLWWRLPIDYKRTLHGIFSAPLQNNGSPSCYGVQVAIKRNAARLFNCVTFHLQQAPRMVYSQEQAFSILWRQWKQNHFHEYREMLLGFAYNKIGDIAVSSSSSNLEELPRLTHFNSTFCDYLFILVSADNSMARN